MPKKFGVLLRIGIILVVAVYFLNQCREIYLEEEKAQAGSQIVQEYIKEAEKAGYTEEILAEIKYFPVAAEYDTGACGSFEDSFMAQRSYGGDRKHEGTDIMAGAKGRGYYPVVSMTDGVVEQAGWLELGGYRVGIRSPEGSYYYYAHLDSYSDKIREGQEIKAGDCLGFMGDSGYGEEGTTGKFDPHLHIGIYVPDTGENAEQTEKALNPYPVLKSFENSKIFFQNTVSK